MPPAQYTSGEGTLGTLHNYWQLGYDFLKETVVLYSGDCSRLLQEL